MLCKKWNILLSWRIVYVLTWVLFWCLFLKSRNNHQINTCEHMNSLPFQSIHHSLSITSLITRFVELTWGPPGAARTQVGPTLATRTMLSGMVSMAGCYADSYSAWKMHRFAQCTIIWKIFQNPVSHISHNHNDEIAKLSLKQVSWIF